LYIKNIFRLGNLSFYCTFYNLNTLLFLDITNHRNHIKIMRSRSKGVTHAISIITNWQVPCQNEGSNFKKSPNQLLRAPNISKNHICINGRWHNSLSYQQITRNFATYQATNQLVLSVNNSRHYKVNPCFN
jgi:hypothetical protein